MRILHPFLVIGFGVAAATLAQLLPLIDQTQTEPSEPPAAFAPAVAAALRITPPPVLPASVPEAPTPAEPPPPVETPPVEQEPAETPEDEPLVTAEPVPETVVRPEPPPTRPTEVLAARDSDSSPGNLPTNNPEADDSEHLPSVRLSSSWAQVAKLCRLSGARVALFDPVERALAAWVDLDAGEVRPLGDLGAYSPRALELRPVVGTVRTLIVERGRLERPVLLLTADQAAALADVQRAACKNAGLDPDRVASTTVVLHPEKPVPFAVVSVR